MTESKVLKLEDLPDSVLSRIIELLPQNSKINLAYTNYKFYEIAIPLIYKKICIRKLPLLETKSAFQSSLYTCVYGSSNILATKKSQDRLFKLRQEILLQSLTLNELLNSYIEEVVIFDEIDDSDDNNDIFNLQLINNIKTNAVNLKKYIVYSNNLNFHLSSKELIKLSNLKSIVLPSIEMLQYLPSTVDQLKIDFINNNNNNNNSNNKINEDKCLDAIYRLTKLDLSGDEIMTVDFLKFLEDILKSRTFKKLSLDRIKVIVYHGFNDYNILCRKLVKDFLFNKCDLNKLKSLEIVCGCDEMACPCLGEFFQEFTDLMKQNNNELIKLSIIQKTVHRDHNYTEKFDMSICEFLKKLPNVDKNLNYLSIRHNPPLDSNMGNGFDGNYLKRKDLYENTLPLLKNLKILIAPLFMQTIACYEQYTSDLLWNGCECKYCDSYLPLFDQYIMKHYYFDESTGLEKDVISSVMFGAASDVMSRRIFSKNDLIHNASDLDILNYPVSNPNWNFHGYFGLRHEIDSNCEFNQSVFPSLIKVTSHFLKDYVQFLSGKLPKLYLFCLNGVYFNIDHNNANNPIVSCIYDSTD